MVLRNIKIQSKLAHGEKLGAQMAHASFLTGSHDCCRMTGKSEINAAKKR
jgi:hypothetical protein